MGGQRARAKERGQVECKKGKRENVSTVDDKYIKERITKRQRKRANIVKQRDKEDDKYTALITKNRETTRNNNKYKKVKRVAAKDREKILT